MPIRKSLRTKFKAIKCLATDVDGVLTDGHIFLASENNWRRSFYIRDGLGIVLLKEKGYKTAFITSSRAEDIRQRADNLKIDFFFDAVKDKEDSFQELLKRGGYKASEVLFIGDDVIDLAVLDQCGISVAPADAHPAVIKRADIVTKAIGGRGAVREICDLLLQYGALA